MVSSNNVFNAPSSLRDRGSYSDLAESAILPSQDSASSSSPSADTNELSPFVGSPYTSAKADRWYFLRTRRRRFLFAAVCLLIPAFFLFAQPFMLEDKRVCLDPLDLEAMRAPAPPLPPPLPPATVTVTVSAALPPPVTVAVTMTAPAITQTAIVPQTIEPVVFSLVMFHEDSAKEGAILLKTAIMYSSRPIHFHIVCDETAQQYLEGRLTLLNHPLHDVVVKFYRMSKQSMEDRVAREGAIYTDHSAGISGLMKLFMHEILPDDVEKAIFVDTDAFFLMDPALLWDDFKKWNSSVAISMPFHPDQGAAQWHYASNICSCVMLLDLKKLRTLRLMDSSIYREDTSGEFPPAFSPPTFVALFGPPGPDGHYLDVALGDQAYWWAIVSNRTEIYTPLSYDWEVSSCLLDMYGTSLGEDAATEDSERPIMLHLYGTPWENQVVHPKLVHFNCLNTDIYFEAESWLDEKNSLTSRWGSVIDYHVGTKWIWLNRGSASVWVETIVDPLFADQRHAAERAQRSTPPDRR